MRGAMYNLMLLALSNRARKRLSLCPQYLSLFPMLRVTPCSCLLIPHHNCVVNHQAELAFHERPAKLSKYQAVNHSHPLLHNIRSGPFEHRSRIAFPRPSKENTAAVRNRLQKTWILACYYVNLDQSVLSWYLSVFLLSLSCT